MNLKMNINGHDMEDFVGVSSTADGLFISCFLGTIVLGITIVQTWNYFRRNKDGWMMQAFVVGMVSLDITESISTIVALHSYLIVHFGDHKYLSTFHPLVPAGFLCTVIIFFLTHMFFAKRIYSVCRRKWLLVLNVTLSFIMFGFGLTASASPWFPVFLRNHAEPSFALTIFHSLGGTLDIIVTVALTMSLSDIHLSAKKFQAGSTKDLLHRVLVYTVTRGIVMTVAQAAHITMFSVRPQDFMFWTSTHFLISKLYVVTTLVTLNSRRNSSRSEEVPAAKEETMSMRFAHRDSVDDDDDDSELEKARAIQSAPAFV